MAVKINLNMFIDDVHSKVGLKVENKTFQLLNKHCRVLFLYMYMHLYSCVTTIQDFRQCLNYHILPDAKNP